MSDQFNKAPRPNPDDVRFAALKILEDFSANQTLGIEQVRALGKTIANSFIQKAELYKSKGNLEKAKEAEDTAKKLHDLLKTLTGKEEIPFGFLREFRALAIKSVGNPEE